MAYTKPAATVRQVQKTASFPLPDPTLESCVVGPGYYWQDPERDDNENSSIYTTSYDGSELVVSGSAFSSHTDYIEDTVIVDLIRTEGPNGTIGSVKHLVKDTDFTVSGENITITADISGFDVDNADKANVRVGFLAKRTDLNNNYQKVIEAQDIIDYVGQPVPWNPLAYGASLAMSNGGVSTNILGVDPGTGGDSSSFSNAVTALENKEKVYAIAPLTRVGSEADKFATHCNAMSVPAEGKERIALVSKRVDYSPEETTPATNSEKQEVAQAIQNVSAASGEKRFFSIHPDAGYVETRAHVSTLSDSFIQAVFGSTFSLKPKFVTNVTAGSTKFRAFSEITSSAITTLKANDIDFVTVYYPVPGYYFGAALVGAVAGKRPEEPLTNSGINGFSMLYKSNDHFNKSQLNTIAEGGTWILEERGVGAIINRHQLSTNATTIQTRELSITTQIDYASKYIRDLVSPLIGKFVISDGFLKQLRAAIVSAGNELVDLGYVRAVDVLNVYQDEVQPDTIKVDLAITPLYPVNYIKITLEF